MTTIVTRSGKGSPISAVENDANLNNLNNNKVEQTGATSSAELPSGTTAQRDGSPSAGYFRYNSTLSNVEYYNGSSWLSPSVASLAVSKTSSTGSAEMPTGTTAQRDGSPTTGFLRFNSTTTSFEGYNGSEWGSIGGGGSGSTSFYGLKVSDYVLNLTTSTSDDVDVSDYDNWLLAQGITMAIVNNELQITI